MNPSALLYRAREKARERDSETSHGGYALLHPRYAAAGTSSLRSNNENVYFHMCESTITTWSRTGVRQHETSFSCQAWKNHQAIYESNHDALITVIIYKSVLINAVIKIHGR